MAKRVGVDKWLFFTTLLLVVVGLAMVFSASAVVAQERYHSEFAFVGRQAGWALAGVLAMLILMHVDYTLYNSPRFIYPALCVTTLLLVLVFFFPGSHNTHRWIRFGGFFTFQPSEIAKPVLVLFLAWFLHTRLDAMRDWKHTLLRAVVMPLVFAADRRAARPGHGAGAGRRDRHDAGAGRDGVEVSAARRLRGAAWPGRAALHGRLAPPAHAGFPSSRTAIPRRRAAPVTTSASR